MRSRNLRLTEEIDRISQTAAKHATISRTQIRDLELEVAQLKCKQQADEDLIGEFRYAGKAAFAQFVSQLDNLEKTGRDILENLSALPNEATSAHTDVLWRGPPRLLPEKAETSIMIINRRLDSKLVHVYDKISALFPSHCYSH